MDRLTLSPLEDPRIPQVYEVLTKAYTGNPAHIALFGRDNFAVNDRLFRIILKDTDSTLYAARSAGRIVGVAGIARHTDPASSRLNQLPFTAASLGATETVIACLQERQAVWAKMEPSEPHVHVGPVAVLPDRQRSGIGSSLMDHCCRIVDRQGELSYLETDGEENLRFYERFGFEVTDQATLFGVPNYFMTRRPRGT